MCTPYIAIETTRDFHSLNMVPKLISAAYKLVSLAIVTPIVSRMPGAQLSSLELIASRSEPSLVKLRSCGSSLYTTRPSGVHHDFALVRAALLLISVRGGSELVGQIL